MASREFTPIFAEQNPHVYVDISAFPPYLDFEHLAINQGLASRLANDTGIRAVSLSIHSYQESPLHYVHPSVPSNIRRLLSDPQQDLGEKTNLAIPYPFPEESDESLVDSLGVVLLVNSQTLQRQMSLDPNSFNYRDISSWAPYLDQHLKQVFLAIGSKNLRAGIQILGASMKSLKLSVKLARLHFDIHSGSLLDAA